ncbi:hypothetical protein OAA67_04140 [Winogradskyella sp.]|nr:hypothetical protein [Winogradskyella sp.]MDB9754931.1 hypothetical protein [Winogradskyella sp.]MDC1504631.1 hypothetical protein [Winogradskyella sp.]
MNKAFGIILYIVGAVFSLTLVGQFFKFVAAITAISRLFSDDTNAYDAGGIVGAILYWLVHITIIYLCFKYGKKRYKKESQHEKKIKK